MMIKLMTLALSLALLCFPSLLPAKKPDAALKAKAKITQEEAAKTAIAKVPYGKIKSAELEKENGNLGWSFDISMPKSKNITEVQVDAITGKVVCVEVETPEQQATDSGSSSR